MEPEDIKKEMEEALAGKMPELPETPPADPFDEDGLGHKPAQEQDEGKY